MKTKTKTEILPCPFCGYPGELMTWRDKAGNVELIEHPNTDCILADLRCEEAELWNTRKGQ